MEVKIGARLASTVCATEIIVIKAPEGDLDITCGGSPMVPEGEGGAGDAGPQSGHDEGALLGKRYEDADAQIELLCVKPGDGSLGLAGTVLTVKGAKPLPSSD